MHHPVFTAFYTVELYSVFHFTLKKLISIFNLFEWDCMSLDPSGAIVCFVSFLLYSSLLLLLYLDWFYSCHCDGAQVFFFFKSSLKKLLPCVQMSS